MLEKAFDYINKIGANNGEYTIILDENETEATADGYTIGSGAGSGKNTKTTGAKTNLKITIQGLGENVTITKTAQGALFTVYGNAATDVPELVLENIKLRGHSGNNKALVIVGNTASKKMGKLTMKDGVQIYGNTSSGVNTGGGVNIAAGGVFDMNGGMIGGVDEGNNATHTSYGGGGGVMVAGSFSMSGGTIAYNSAKKQGGGVSIGANGYFEMSDGSLILNNTVTGTSVPLGGGVFSGGVFRMTGGTIGGNTAPMGGGVGINGNMTFEMTDGVIFGNTASMGGAGVLHYKPGVFIKTGGIIYGTEGANANKGGETVHAMELWNGTSGLTHYRDTDSTEGHILSADSKSVPEQWTAK
jgi:hypothetical protein